MSPFCLMVTNRLNMRHQQLEVHLKQEQNARLSSANEIKRLQEQIEEQWIDSVNNQIEAIGNKTSAANATAHCSKTGIRKVHSSLQASEQQIHRWKNQVSTLQEQIQLLQAQTARQVQEAVEVYCHD